MNTKEVCVDVNTLRQYVIVSADTEAAARLADGLEDAFGIRLSTALPEAFSGSHGIYIGTRAFHDYGGYRCALTREKESVYLDGSTQALLHKAQAMLIAALKSGTLPEGEQYGYCWKEEPEYGLSVTACEAASLCAGVTYLHRSYRCRSGEPVEAYIVLADPDSPAKAAVWGCPQGQSMVVPGQVEQMRSLGKDVIAAVNADFFHFFNNGDKTTFGAQIIDGVVYKEPNCVEHYGTNWFGLTHSGAYVMSDMEGYFATYRGALQQAVGGGVWLVRNGAFCPHSSKAVEPRTAVGITREGGVALVCVDGRSERSVGATYADLTQVFMDLEVEFADVLNLDGGHSTILMGKQADGSMAILNNPSSGPDALRPVADILTLVLPKEN